MDAFAQVKTATVFVAVLVALVQISAADSAIYEEELLGTQTGEKSGQVEGSDRFEMAASQDNHQMDYAHRTKRSISRHMKLEIRCKKYFCKPNCSIFRHRKGEMHCRFCKYMNYCFESLHGSPLKLS